MSVDFAILQPIRNAFEKGDISEVLRLIRANPEYLTCSDGTDRWMSEAVMDGNLAMLSAIVSLGLNVNLSCDLPDPSNPFCQFEGPILQAASKGHLEIVRWLLEQGARINYMVNGRVRCLPLLDATRKGYLEIVNMLIEHGADLTFVFNGHTLCSHAVDFGQFEMAAYLRSIGAK